MHFRWSGKTTDNDIAVIGRQMRVNGVDLLSFEYDLAVREVRVQDRKERILTVKYDDHGRPVTWTPPAGIKPVQMKYDAFSNLLEWRRGPDSVVTYKYDLAGRLVEVVINNASTLFDFGPKLSNTQVISSSVQHWSCRSQNAAIAATPILTNRKFLPIHSSYGQRYSLHVLILVPPKTNF